uniref:Uncharacterized protein n=1 Tax=Arundo donax TaxID=35708 RepID=A0A0A8YL16_ARUDO
MGAKSTEGDTFRGFSEKYWTAINNSDPI